MKINLILLIIIIAILLLTIFYNSNKKLNKKFYSCKEIFPELLNIKKYNINDEVINYISYIKWIDWPESDLYQDSKINGNWKIVPFYGFGTWCNSNCDKFPELTKFLKTLKNLKIAILSKIGPKTRLQPHYGWSSHSNYVLRCHYGILLPKNKNDSFIAVQENENDSVEIQLHKQNDWIIFDDSKLHYAVNNSDEERIVLIVDLERPSNIEIGKSDIQDTKELLEVINEMKKSNSIN
jgi:aspartyl/asparaginyl beta-hydroxylase (cupin superfamily)